MTNLILEPAHKGLAGVVVAETKISDVQASGSLVFRGEAIEDLVDRDFVDVAALVVDGYENDEVRHLLARHANLTEVQSNRILALDRSMHPMRVLQGMVPLLAAELDELDPRLRGLLIGARLPAIVATHLVGTPVQLAEDLDYASRFLAAIGTDLSSANVRAFNVAQILQLEHSFNAGTFAARVVASTLADIECAISAGIGALSGPLHGGADQAAIEIVDQLGDAASVRTYVKDALLNGSKVPGMGHREYRVKDPRAGHLEKWAQELADGTVHQETFEKLRMLEEVFAEAMRDRGKDVHANVEFYKGVVYRALGLPNDYFTACFAMARAFGYVAHFLENAVDNRIYRPAAAYVGA